MTLVAVDQSRLYRFTGGGVWWACKCKDCGVWLSKFDDTREQTLLFGQGHRCGLAGSYQVDLPPHGDHPGYCCGFLVDVCGAVRNAAPVLGSWVGQHVDEFAAWARARGATFKRLE